jgi:hypothetical protein
MPMERCDMILLYIGIPLFMAIIFFAEWSFVKDQIIVIFLLCIGAFPIPLMLLIMAIATSHPGVKPKFRSKAA